MIGVRYGNATISATRTRNKCKHRHTKHKAFFFRRDFSILVNAPFLCAFYQIALKQGEFINPSLLLLLRGGRTATARLPLALATLAANESPDIDGLALALAVLVVLHLHLLEVNVAHVVHALRLSEVLDSGRPQVLGNGNGQLLALLVHLDDRVVVLVLLLLIILFLLGLRAALLELRLGLRALLGRDVAAAAHEPEPREERSVDRVRCRQLLRQRLVLGEILLQVIAGLLAGLEQLDGHPVQALAQILALLPLHGHGLGDQPGHAIARATPVERLLEHGVLEEVVGLELEAEGDGAGVAVFGVGVDFRPADGDGGEGLGEDLRVLRLDELVDFWRAGLEDDGPEVGDGGSDFGAFGVGGFGEGVLLLD